MCYLAVGAIGLAGLANRRWVSLAILALATFGAMMLPPLTFTEAWTIPQLAVRSAIMFSAGALLYQWRDKLPARWSLVAAGAVVVVAASQLPDYRVFGALPLAYVVVASGVLIHKKRLRLRNDLSYGVYIYAYPTQQMLAVCGLSWLNPAAFFALSAIATLPLAALSWFLVEKPARTLKLRLKRRWSLRDLAESTAPDVGPIDQRPAPETPSTA